jgi:hypothetical protein
MPEPRYICVRSDGAGRLFLEEPEWPLRALIADDLVRTEDRIHLSYPYLSIRLDNAHAVYRVDTCERGLWTGALVESYLEKGAPR